MACPELQSTIWPALQLNLMQLQGWGWRQGGTCMVLHSCRPPTHSELALRGGSPLYLLAACMKARLSRTVLPCLPALQPASESASADRGHEDASGARQQVQTSACCMPLIQNMSLPGILPAVAAADGDVSLPCCCSHLTEEPSRSCCGSVSFCGCSFPASAGLVPACRCEMGQRKLSSMTCKSLLLSGAPRG